MRIRELRKDDLNDAVRILALCFEKEIKTIFKDVDIAREIIKDFFEENPNGCYVVEEDRVVAIAWFVDRKLKVLKFLKSQMGFLEGLRAYLLLRFFLKKPKKGEGFLIFIAVSPLRQRTGIGSALMREIISLAKSMNLKRLNCIIPANSDLVTFFKNLDFEAVKVFENNLAEKYFFSREWFFLSKDLSA